MDAVLDGVICIDIVVVKRVIWRSKGSRFMEVVVGLCSVGYALLQQRKKRYHVSDSVSGLNSKQSSLIKALDKFDYYAMMID